MRNRAGPGRRFGPGLGTVELDTDKKTENGTAVQERR